MPPTLPPSWRPLIAEERDKPYFRTLEHFLEKQRQSYIICPPEKYGKDVEGT